MYIEQYIYIHILFIKSSLFKIHIHFGYFNNITVYSRHSFFLSIDPEMELLNDISLCLISWVTATFLFLAAVHFTFLPSTYKDSNLYTSSQLSLLWFFQAISPGECEVALMAMPSCASSLMMMLSDCLCVYEP